jgi:hypothetical protein
MMVRHGQPSFQEKDTVQSAWLYQRYRRILQRKRGTVHYLKMKMRMRGHTHACGIPHRCHSASMNGVEEYKRSRSSRRQHFARLIKCQEVVMHMHSFFNQENARAEYRDVSKGRREKAKRLFSIVAGDR